MALLADSKAFVSTWSSAFGMDTFPYGYQGMILPFIRIFGCHVWWIFESEQAKLLSTSEQAGLCYPAGSAWPALMKVNTSVHILLVLISWSAWLCCSETSLLSLWKEESLTFSAGAGDWLLSNSPHGPGTRCSFALDAAGAFTSLDESVFADFDPLWGIELWRWNFLILLPCKAAALSLMTTKYWLHSSY
jgi:hypothetical protein